MNLINVEKQMLDAFFALENRKRFSRVSCTYKVAVIIYEPIYRAVESFRHHIDLIILQNALNESNKNN